MGWAWTLAIRTNDNSYFFKKEMVISQLSKENERLADEVDQWKLRYQRLNAQKEVRINKFQIQKKIFSHSKY